MAKVRAADDVTVTVAAAGATIVKDAGARDAGGGWYRANATADDGVTATVFTNIENSMAKFAATHVTDVDNGITVNLTTGLLTLSIPEGELGDDERAAIGGLIVSGSFPKSPSGALTYTYGTNTETVTFEGPPMFAGTFNGVPGEYACAGTCSATNTNGKLTALFGGVWTFTPDYFGVDNMSHPTDTTNANRDDDSIEPNVAIADMDYLRFGWWTKVAADGAVSFQTFFGGNDAFTVGDIGGLEGTATYKGPAAGRYAVKTFNSNSTLDSIRHGEFTAAAELTASFGGDDIAVNDQNTISGTVTYFASRSDDLSAWSVDLKKTTFTSTTDAFSSPADEVGVAGGVGGSPVNDGKWSGQFFGIPAADTGTPDATDDYPNSVAGEFDAHSSHGHVAGGFGAVKQ
jgi:hypothetical protein